MTPNGVNLQQFQSIEDSSSLLANQSSGKIRIALVTRLDQDKKFILDVFYKGLKFTTEKFPQKISWVIVGDGKLKNEVYETTKQILGNDDFVMSGWLGNDGLNQEYNLSDIVIAPGRCALEAMACEKPTIAIGSKCYVGLISQTKWQDGVYTNFGGTGNKMEGYVEGTIEKDLGNLILNAEYRKELGRSNQKLISSFYDEDSINKKILSIYEILTSFNGRE